MDEQDRAPRPADEIDEESYGASAAESGGLYNEDGPTATSVTGDTMGERDEGEPGKEPPTDPESG
ncbi:MAG TPA: hypothetical protein VHK63_05995 [Candidatus Limnocylindria bacterium]|nr:hypothetical protein [Candidatus Limnocylindria bacterium]